MSPFARCRYLMAAALVAAATAALDHSIQRVRRLYPR
jgi:hypothetical protein